MFSATDGRYLQFCSQVQYPLESVHKIPIFAFPYERICTPLHSICILPKLQLQSLKQIPNSTTQMLVRLRKCVLGNLILRIQLQLLYQCSGIYCIVQSVMESAFRLYLCTFKCILQAVAPV